MQSENKLKCYCTFVCHRISEHTQSWNGIQSIIYLFSLIVCHRISEHTQHRQFKYVRVHDLL